MKWPHISSLKAYSLWALLLTILFVVIYGGANSLAATSAKIYQLGLPVEKSIPLFPPALMIYFSLQILFILPVFYLSEDEIHRLGQSLTLGLLVGGLFFYFFPTATLYQRTLPEGIWGPAFGFLYSWDNAYNSFPSMHICFSFLLVCFLKNRSAKSHFYWGWFFLICLSVLLTHQHHLADILSGWMLGFLIWRFRKPQLA